MLIVTISEKGCVYPIQQDIYDICPVNKVLVVDTTGACDAFCGGLTDDKTLDETVIIGNHLAPSNNTCASSKKKTIRGLSLYLPQKFCIDIDAIIK